MQHKLLLLKFVNMQDNASPFLIWSIYKYYKICNGNKRIHGFKGDDKVGHFVNTNTV